jgi:RNA polymerase sigma-70 factor (ECF subfamily)
VNTPQPPSSTGTLSDSQVVERVRSGERALFEVLMRRYNQRLYRVVRAVLKSEHDVEDVMQQTYVNAYVHLHQFAERSRFSTWLTRIALNEAFGHRRRTRLVDPVPADEESGAVRSPQPDPEHQAYSHELQHFIEEAIDALPEGYRIVFVLRDIEGLTTSETGEGLGLGVDVIKTRLHRARVMLRRSVNERLGDGALGVFRFHAPRCDRVVREVFGLLALGVGAERPDEVPA